MCSLQLCSFLSRLIWLFTDLCGSILILEFFHKSTFKPRLLKKTKPNQTCTSYNQSRMFQIIIYFSITYYGSPNMCLYHLHRKLWLPSLALSRSISAVRTTSKCQRATHFPAACWGQQSRILAGSSHSSSGAQSLNTERCCLDSLHLKPWGREFFQSSPLPPPPGPGCTGSLWIMSSYVSAKAQISKGLCTSCSGLLTSYPGGSLGNAQLGNWY